MVVRPCTIDELDEVGVVINAAAEAYRGVIASDRWHDPYMAPDELRREVEDGVVFWGAYVRGHLIGVMGLQDEGDVALVRHAYTRTAHQGQGVGTALLLRLRGQTERAMLVGTWRSATWAVRFYQRHGFGLVTDDEARVLLRRYWTVPERQIEESVVLADVRWPR